MPEMADVEVTNAVQLLERHLEAGPLGHRMMRDELDIVGLEHRNGGRLRALSGQGLLPFVVVRNEGAILRRGSS